MLYIHLNYQKSRFNQQQPYNTLNPHPQNHIRHKRVLQPISNNQFLLSSHIHKISNTQESFEKSKMQNHIIHFIHTREQLPLTWNSWLRLGKMKVSLFTNALLQSFSQFSLLPHQNSPLTLLSKVNYQHCQNPSFPPNWPFYMCLNYGFKC